MRGERNKMIQMFVMTYSGEGSRPLIHRFDWSNVTRYGLLTFSFQHATALADTEQISWCNLGVFRKEDVGNKSNICQMGFLMQCSLRYSNWVHLGVVRYGVNMKSRSLGGTIILECSCSGKAVKNELLNKVESNRLLFSHTFACL